MSFLKQYLFNLLLGTSQATNALLLGDPDESISGRTGRALSSGQAKWWVKPLGHVIDKLFLWLLNEKDHVKNSIEPEELNEKELWSWIRGEG